MESGFDIQLKKELRKTYGEEASVNLAKKYLHAFPHAYADENNLSLAIHDIEYLEGLSNETPIALSFYQVGDELHLRLFQWERSIALSDIVPALENFDLRILNEVPHHIQPNNHPGFWISDFLLLYKNADGLDIEAANPLFQSAFKHIYAGHAENDGLNRLILSAKLAWRDVVILRAYMRYLRQTVFRFSQPTIEKTLATHPKLSKQLVDYFKLRHDPELKTQDIQLKKHTNHLLNEISNISNLDEDRIMRRLLELINATVRTNFFQTASDGKCKHFFSIKLHSRAIPELPQPVPLYEIYVYGMEFEGIHLRNSKVARGGIRWSERLEDFRTEILGLMKAQTVKNAVIVPSGAKGGFVLKKSVAPSELKKYVTDSYCAFINGLLDLTDNIVNNQFIPPKQVRCHDDIDPYLVVAADKGTASFSNIANELAAKHHFWLGDAFASGGSHGYDHKAMGITARGAFESVRRHFRELNIDIDNHDFSVVGIGDMSGDVFGNGMLYSKHIRLIAAFDHRHVFIDPNPDPEKSYQERLRLFNLPTSSWADYAADLISKGGGIFSRDLKTIPLSKEARTVLGISDDNLAPSDLIRAILAAPVDLLYNGGIGTYVKSSEESNEQVGDRSNDYCRINGNELRCKIVGEGGNLGFTQRGRIEYALRGGLINTDFIDNSAGVDCSDHEVNLKILLDTAIHKKLLKWKERDPLLKSLTDEIAQLVLQDNRQQALIISFTSHKSELNLALHQGFMQELEDSGLLMRKVEFLPDNKILAERKAEGRGLTRPEIAVLLAYSKIQLQQAILKSSLSNDPLLKNSIATAFPPKIQERFGDIMAEHRLAHEIGATQLSNDVINAMGITFYYRMKFETGAALEEIIRAYTVSSHIFGIKSLQNIILSLDFKLAMNEQYDMLYNLRRLINIATRWFLRHQHLLVNPSETIALFSSQVHRLEHMICHLMSGQTLTYLEQLEAQFKELGLCEKVANRIASYRAIYATLNIIELARVHQFDLEKTAKMYFLAGERLNLVWFRDQIANDHRDGHWNALAKLTLRDELDITQTWLTLAIMRCNAKDWDDVNEAFICWQEQNLALLARWDYLQSLLKTAEKYDYADFFTMIHELKMAIKTSTKA